jgi:transcriptional regulator with XRE-family HTH domain
MTAFGDELRRRRIESGQTLGQFARRMHYSTGYLSKIETGRKPPAEDLARRCDAALGANGALLAMLPRPRPVGRPPASGRTPAGGRTERAGEVAPQGAGRAWPWPAGGDPDVAELAGAPAVAGGGLGPGELGWGGLGEPPARLRAAADLDDTVGTFRVIFDQYRELGHQVSPRMVLDLLARPTGMVRALATGARDPDQHRRLMLLAARYAEYTGWMAQESGDNADAMRWTAFAARLAGAVGGTDLVQFALVRGADLALYQADATRTIELAQRAQADDRVAARLRGLAAQREAQGHALAGNHGACMRALDRSATLLAADAGGEGSDGNPPVGSTSLSAPVATAITTGWALYDLGRPVEAARILDAEVPHMATSKARSRARFGVRCALAHAAAGELERACELAADLLPVVQRADSATIRLDLARLAHNLRRWHADPRVRELLPAVTRALRTYPD